MVFIDKVITRGFEKAEGQSYIMMEVESRESSTDITHLALKLKVAVRNQRMCWHWEGQGNRLSPQNFQKEPAMPILCTSPSNTDFSFSLSHHELF